MTLRATNLFNSINKKKCIETEIHVIYCHCNHSIWNHIPWLASTCSLSNILFLQQQFKIIVHCTFVEFLLIKYDNLISINFCFNTKLNYITDFLKFLNTSSKQTFHNVNWQNKDHDDGNPLDFNGRGCCRIIGSFCFRQKHLFKKKIWKGCHEK